MEDLACIYCGQKDNLSEEHYLPRGLGKFRGYEPLKGRICAECNNVFSPLDEQILRSGREAFLREILGIEGRRRKGEKRPSPFLRGSAGAPPLLMETMHPKHNIKIYLEVIRGTRTARPLRQLVLLDQGGQWHGIRIPDHMKESSQLRAELHSRGVERILVGHILLNEDTERTWIEHLFSDFKADGPIEWSTTGDDEETYDAKIVVTTTVTQNYFRGLAKIGFHYFLCHIKHFRGSEDAFEGIRNFIKNGGTTEDFLEERSDQVIEQLKLGCYRLNCWGHILVAEMDYQMLRAKVQLFVGPEFLAPVYIINLGRNPLRIDYSECKAHFFRYFEAGEVDGFCGEVEKIKPVPRYLLP